MKKNYKFPIPQKDHILGWTEEEQEEFNTMLYRQRMHIYSMFPPTPTMVKRYQNSQVEDKTEQTRKEEIIQEINRLQEELKSLE